MIVTFIAVMIGWVLFRANSIADAKTALTKMAHPGGMLFNGEGKPAILLPVLLIVLLVIREIRNERDSKLRLTSNNNIYVSAISTALLVIVILMCAHFESGQFIYFQF